MEPDYWGSQAPLLDHWGASGPLAPLVPTPLWRIANRVFDTKTTPATMQTGRDSIRQVI